MGQKAMLGIIGCGNMGAAIARGQKQAYLYDQDKTKLRKLTVRKGLLAAQNIADLIQRSSVLLVAVKPQDIKVVLQEIRLKAHQPLVISLAAGISLKQLRQQLGSAARIVRVMPNLAAQVKKSVNFICLDKTVSKNEIRLVKSIFAAVGAVVMVNEKVFDKVTALSGSGIGYVFYLMQVMYQQACAYGFDQKTAQLITKQVFSGAAELAQTSSLSFAQLALAVASKKGTTEAAFKTFNQRKLAAAFKSGIEAARKRAQQLHS